MIRLLSLWGQGALTPGHSPASIPPPHVLCAAVRGGALGPALPRRIEGGHACLFSNPSTKICTRCLCVQGFDIPNMQPVSPG